MELNSPISRPRQCLACQFIYIGMNKPFYSDQNGLLPLLERKWTYFIHTHKKRDIDNNFLKALKGVASDHFIPLGIESNLIVANKNEMRPYHF